MNIELRISGAEERAVITRALESFAHVSGNLTVWEEVESADLQFAFDSPEGVRREGRLRAEHRMGTEEERIAFVGALVATMLGLEAWV